MSLLWSHPFQIQYDESISTPAVGTDMVLVTATGRPLTALRITRVGGKADKKSRLDQRDFVELSVEHGGQRRLRLWHERRWRVLLPAACATASHVDRRESGLLFVAVIVGNRLFALNERGLLQVLSADPTSYNELGGSQLAASETWTMPAVVGNRLFVRSTEGLACFEIQP